MESNWAEYSQSGGSKLDLSLKILVTLSRPALSVSKCVKIQVLHLVTAQSNTNKGREEGGDDEINFRSKESLINSNGSSYNVHSSNIDNSLNSGGDFSRHNCQARDPSTAR